MAIIFSENYYLPSFIQRARQRAIVMETGENVYCATKMFCIVGIEPNGDDVSGQIDIKIYFITKVKLCFRLTILSLTVGRVYVYQQLTKYDTSMILKHLQRHGVNEVEYGNNKLI